MRSNRRSCNVLGALGVLLVVSYARAAGASSSYPAYLKDQLRLPATPDCTLCHRDDNGGTGTVVTPFGQSMMGFGLRGSDTASLSAALAADDTRDWDSDGDGVPDIEELKEGKDPNDGPVQAAQQLVNPEHGCSAGRAPGRWLVPAWLSILALLWRARARVSRSR